MSDDSFIGAITGSSPCCRSWLSRSRARSRSNNPLRTKQSVSCATFYEEFGWKKEGDLYLDTLTFVDTRPLSLEHLARCHRRIGRELPASGRFVLDAASCPVQFPEYRRLSGPFDFRVCIDFSVRALREAQSNLGDRGLYLLGDVTRLPLRDGSMD